MRLGKLDYRHDPKTARIGPMLATDVKIPLTYDFDKGRTAFPRGSFGNDAWGNCVKVGQTLYTFRAERVETRQTPIITPADVIEAYKQECQREFGQAPANAGDQNDNGLVVLYNLRNWRNVGWQIRPTKTAKRVVTQRIDAYGELDKNNTQQLRQGIYLLNGIMLGLSLPLTAQGQTRSHAAWDVVQTDAPEAQPGSWGGHLVYCKQYTPAGIVCRTWDMDVLMTNAFISRYCDEAWALVDSLDGKTSRYLDVAAMEKHLRDIGARVNA